MNPFHHKQIVAMRQMEASLASGSRTATIVPFQKNYETDTQLCLSVNAYIPIEIASIIHSRLIEPLQSIDQTQYYYPNTSLHITFHSIRIIHFPPTYTQKDIDTSKMLLTKHILSQQPFSFILHGVLSLPTSVTVIALITPEYDRFINDLRRAFVQAGIPDDKTYFTNEIVFANTTICRYTHVPSPEFLKKVTSLKDTFISKFTAKEVTLVETNAVSHPSKTRILGTYTFR